MNNIEARWLRIKRYDGHDLEALHSAERNADLAWREHYSNGRYKAAGEGWEVAGIRYMDSLDKRLGPYWDSGKLSDETSREIALFQACPVVRRLFAKHASTELTEQAFFAQADFEIHSKAYMPNLSKGTGDNKRALAALYAKSEPSKLPYQD